MIAQLMAEIDTWLWLDWFMVGVLLGAILVVAWRRLSVVPWGRARPWSFFAGLLLGSVLTGGFVGAYDDGWSVLSDPLSLSNRQERLDREQTERRLERVEAGQGSVNPCGGR